MLLDAPLALLEQICQESACLLFPIKGNKNMGWGGNLVNIVSLW